MREVPADSSLNTLFRNLTDRATNQAELHNEGLSAYLADLLADFSHRKNLYRFRGVDIPEASYVCQLLDRATRLSGEDQQVCYQHAGDYTLFVLGMFPQRSADGASKLLHLVYAYTGPRSYLASSRLESEPDKRKILEDLSEHFESCVLSLNWVQEYTADPFYRYMLKEFGVT